MAPARTPTSCTLGVRAGDVARALADLREPRRRAAGRLYTMAVRTGGVIDGRHVRSGRRKSATRDRTRAKGPNLGRCANARTGDRNYFRMR